MQHSPAAILATHLRSLEINSETPWYIFDSIMPDGADGPDNAVCVALIPSKLQGRIQMTGQMVEHPGVQVRVRATDGELAYQKIAEFRNVLDALRNQGVTMDDGTEYIIQSITRRTGILGLGIEQGTQRENYVIDATMSLL